MTTLQPGKSRKSVDAVQECRWFTRSFLYLYFFKTLTHEPLCQSRGRLVDGALAVLVLDGDEGAALEEVLGAVLELPEAGVVHRRVTVLVDEVDVRLVLQQLRKRGRNIYL